MEKAPGFTFVKKKVCITQRQHALQRWGHGGQLPGVDRPTFMLKVRKRFLDFSVVPDQSWTMCRFLSVMVNIKW